jgi:hypothetical protein
MLCQNLTTSKVILTSVDENGNSIPGGTRLELPGGAEVKYEIRISNSCAEPGGCAPTNEPGDTRPAGTDFRFYYDAISDPAAARKFDLRKAQELTTLPPTPIPIPGHPDLGLDGDPQACHATGLGKTGSLPKGGS